MRQPPQAVWGGDYVCRYLFIPNNLTLMSAVTDCLADLLYPLNWGEDGTMTPDEITQAFQFTMKHYRPIRDCPMIGEMKFFGFEPTLGDDWLSFGNTYNSADYPDFVTLFPQFVDDPDDTFTLPDIAHHYFVQGSGDSLEVVGNEEVLIETDNIPEMTIFYTGAEATIINGGLEAPAPSAVPILLSTNVGESEPEPLPIRPLGISIYAVIRGKL